MLKYNDGGLHVVIKYTFIIIKFKVQVCLCVCAFLAAQAVAALKSRKRSFAA